MPNGINPQTGADDGIDFQPLTATPKQAARPLSAGTATRPTQAGDGIDFQPMQSQQPASTPASTISPREPSLVERMKNVFTQGAPSGSTLGRLSSRVYQPGDERRDIQLARPEAAMTPTEQRQHPVLTGLGELAGGLTTAQNVGIIAGTAGFGGLPGAAGRVLPRLVSGYFSAQMLKGAYDQYPEFRRAVDAEDYSEAKRLATHIAGNVVLAGFAGRHAVRGGVTAPAETPVEEPVTAQPKPEVTLRKPMLALPPARPTPVETIGGEPVNVRIYPSDEAPLITPEPTRTPEGAIISPRSPLSSRLLLPPAGAPSPPEESEFLSGKSSAHIPPLRSMVQRGPLENYAEGYRPRLSTSLAAPTTPSTPDIDFKPLTEQTTAARPKSKAAIAAAENEGRIQAGLRRTIGDEQVPQDIRDAAKAELDRRFSPTPAVPSQKAPKLTITPPLSGGKEVMAQTSMTSRATPTGGLGQLPPELKAPELTQLEKAEATPYQRQQAQLATNRLRNPVEREYAQSYLKSRLEGGTAPEPISSLSASRASVIADKIEEFLGKQQPTKVSERFAPDVVSEAEAEMRAGTELAGSFERPGRYMVDPGEMGDKIQNPTWYGIKSSRGMVAGQFPWYSDEEITPAKLQAAIERGKGADYERIVGKIAESIHAERESARPILEEFGSQLRELADQVRDIDPEKAQLLTDLAEGRAGRGLGNLRDYIERNVSDARAAALFSKAVDEAADAAGEPSRTAEPAAMAGGPHEAANILPGLEEAVGEQKRAAGQRQAEQLTEQINRPADSIDFIAGEIETKSPLFRGTEASPQNEMFATKSATQPDVKYRRGNGTVVRESKGVYSVRIGEREIARTDNLADAQLRLDNFKEGWSGPTKLSAGIDPTMLREGARIAQQAWQEKIARPFIDKVLKIGDKYQKARAADPAVAEGLHLLDNAPQYLRQKAAQQVHDVVGDLSRAQERLFVLMADADSRENLRANHPAEYRQALNDRGVQEALRKYQPLERELTSTRQRLGGDTLEGDYLRRMYDKYVAGIGKEQAPGSAERGTSAYDRVIRPQRIGSMTREATAEYHYQNGLHELGPAYATKFIGTNLRALRDQVAKEFISKATQVEPGAAEPRSIEYNGETYYRPDIAREMRDGGQKNLKVYDRYDPTAGEKFPQAADGKFLGPREVVNALNDFGRREDAGPGALRRFFQEQIIGFGFGVPHVANILRRVTQNASGGALNPKGWADAWRVAFSKELRERGIEGINDPTFEKLLRQGAITTGEMANLKEYWGGNFNPANWARAMAQVGHKVLFEPGSAGGFGGIDQRARIHVADLMRSQRPELSDEQIARGVRDALGDYNRANWSDRQKMLAKFMMFPGWDASSVRWVIQHPIKTAVPPAVLTLLANQALHQIGANRAEDKSDIDTVHVGDRAYGTGLLRESVARNLFRPFINYAQAKLEGANEQRAQTAAARGMTSGAGGLLSMLRPDLSGFMALATNRQALFSGRELVGRDDLSTPGKILPSRALEKIAVFAVRKAIPSLDRMLDSDQELDLKSFAGGNLGVSNYRDDAERRLLRNAAESERTFQTVSKLAKTNPAQAREYMHDPDNAAYALFHRDFSQVVTALKRIDETREHIENSGLPAADKQNRLAALDKSRQTLLGHADTLNNVLFGRRQNVSHPRLGLLSQPAPRVHLGVQ